ncbi:GTPase Era [Miniphocaeibacter massiliensis]|uniref:GTPase Era n=1 Tax=Miniphocaeibacter massiliensis TaxID=2041841 RepID=UPI000C073C5F|nr:GTPase Era [Miniphocaeibacter massiliensis]
MFKSGFITVLGRSNVGKSTFLNKIMGEKLSIISNKPQTTRNKIKLIYTNEKMQCVFLDTPGIQKPKNKLGEYMLKVSKESLNEVDVVTYIVDTSVNIGENEQYIIDFLKDINTPIILLINKVDIVSQEEIEKIKNMYEKLEIFKKIIPISALSGVGIDKYFSEIYEILPEGPMYYEEDDITDQPVKQIVSEIIREKTLNYLQDEIPHGINIVVESMKTRNNSNMYDIHATIVVEKKSHKGMVIGKNGQMIKKIGTGARKDIETFLDSNVNLKLWVKIDPDWRNKDTKLKEYGYK